jgi:hypothetical protein
MFVKELMGVQLLFQQIMLGRVSILAYTRMVIDPSHGKAGII